MDRYDRLPAELRNWLSSAALPWSVQSVLRLWSRLHRETGGDTSRMIRRMDLAEQRMLMRDMPRIWGEGYPPAQAASGSGAAGRAGGPSAPPCSRK